MYVGTCFDVFDMLGVSVEAKDASELWKSGQSECFARVREGAETQMFPAGFTLRPASVVYDADVAPKSNEECYAYLSEAFDIYYEFRGTLTYRMPGVSKDVLGNWQTGVTQVSRLSGKFEGGGEKAKDEELEAETVTLSELMKAPESFDHFGYVGILQRYPAFACISTGT